MISNNIDLAVALLSDDQLIGMPTETVYGLAGNAFSETAIQKIYSTKERPSFNPLIVHIKGIEDLGKIAVEIPDMAMELARKFWPGPLTLILKKHPSVSHAITAGQETVAVRIPRHPVALELLSRLDFPLVAPSANPFGSTSPTRAEHVDRYFSEKIPMVLQGGPCEAGVESTIIGFEGAQPILYRYGAISREAIEEITGPVTVFNKADKNPEAPGMILKHYAPKTNFILTDDVATEITKHPGKRIGVLILEEPKENWPVQRLLVLSEDGNLETAAARLYDAMHELDGENLDLILAQRFPDSGLGSTINDRLERAAHN